jgi:multisubunit Na+/H+ antiporter MnhG subunit
MSVNQFIITAIIAMLLGGVLCLLGSFLLAKFKQYYNKLTFKHEVLAPYTPNKIKKDKQ